MQGLQIYLCGFQKMTNGALYLKYSGFATHIDFTGACANEAAFYGGSPAISSVSSIEATFNLFKDPAIGEAAIVPTIEDTYTPPTATYAATALSISLI